MQSPSAGGNLPAAAIFPHADLGALSGLHSALSALYVALDKAEGLSPMERLRLLKELGNIRKELGAGPGALQKLRLSKRLGEVRARLGVAVSVAKEEAEDPTTKVIPFGLQASGIKTREKINAQAREIVGRAEAGGLKLADLTDEDRAILAQYSGRGGLTENSQSEYHTPPHIAQGTWDMLAANGFVNGNVLEPSAGAGVFSATKPAGTIISGAEIDPTSAAVAQLLNPADKITNTSFERYAQQVEDDSFDAVAGNVPFGVRGKEGHHDPAYKSEKRMERYFVRRVIDKVRPGGLITLVVPTSVVGKKDGTWERWRADLSMHAEFLGAHKLPSKTFAKQGTDTVTDIIVLRKHPRELLDKIDKLPVDLLRSAGVLWPEFLEGRYWQGEGRRYIHGDYIPPDPTKIRSQEQVIAPPDMSTEAMKQRLAARFESRIDWAALEAAPVTVRAYGEGERKVINGQPMQMQGGKWVPYTPATEEETLLDKSKYGVDTLDELQSLLTTPEGMLSLNADQAYRAWKKYPHLFNGVQAQAVEFAMSQPQDKFRDVAYRGSLLGAMVSKYAIGQDATDRDRVIGLLRAEMVKYGHPTKINGMVLDGAKAQAFGAYLSAIDSEGNVSAAVRGAVEDARGYEPGNILSIVQHLGKQSGDAIDVAAVAALYRGPRKLQALGDLADVDGLAITAHGEIVTMGAYCSGDIYDKVGEIQAAMAGESDARLKDHWARLIDALLARVKHTDVSNIGFGLRDNWIPNHFKTEFLRVNGFPSLTFNEIGAAGDDEGDGGEDGGEEDSAPARTGGVWVYRGKDEFAKQLAGYMGGRGIAHNLRDRDNSPKEERATVYQERVEGLEQQFKFFMQAHPDAADLASTYDMTFNRYVAPEYDTSDLGLKGVAKTVKTHPYQNAGVRRLSDEGSGILGYDVGLGKTFTALAFSQYDRQMGRSNKHCIVVPKSVLANWYMESKKFLGNHEGVLFVGFEPKRNKAGAIVTETVKDEKGQPKRNEHTGEIEFQDVLVEDSSAEVFAKMHSIPAMSAGLVVMTQEKFKAIPVKPETVASYADKWVERSMASAASAKAMAGKEVKAGSYAQQQQQANLENQFYAEGTKKKDELPFFEDMGFDRVVVDEAHHFKASFQVKEGMDKMAYLPNPAESQRAQDMALKLSHIRGNNAGKGAILLTATPVSNSPIEIYNVLMHVIPVEELDKLGIYTPADFVRFFGRIEMVDKLTVANVTEKREGLKGFRNLNVLRGLFNRYANMMGARDVDPEGSVLKLPDAIEVKSEAEMTDEQKDAYVRLREEAKKAGNPKNIAAGLARPMFAVLRDMDRVTTDVDLYKKTMTFLFRASERDKVQALIADLPAFVERVEEDDETGEKVKVKVEKVTTFDLTGDTITYVAPQEFETAIAVRLPKHKIGYASHPMTPKYAELVKNLKAELARGGKQLIFTEEKSQHGKLERLLVESLPEEAKRIGIINADTAGGEKLQQIVDAFTRGDYSIIVANKKAEIGVNLNKGTTAVHHMTLPWTPASIQQRNGRAVRQGNKESAVRIYYYQAKGSFDAYRLDLLAKKAGWIGALLDKSNTDDEHDNEDAGSDLEHAALLSDNREEFLAKVAEQQAKKDAEAKERRDTAAKIGLSQIAAAREFLRTFEARKAKVVAEAANDLAKAEAALKKAEADGPGDDQAAHERLLARRKDTVLRLRRKAETAGPEMDAKKSDAEARQRQIAGTLKAQAARGQLPFAEKLIDAPDDAIIASNKVVVYPGGFFEIEMGRSSTKSVFRAISTDKVNGTVEVEFVSGEGRSGSGYDVDRLLGQSGREIVVNDDDLQVMRLLREPLSYAEIESRVSRDVFEANVARVKMRGVFLSRVNGDLKVIDSYGATDQPVYPDRGNQALRKEVAAMWGRALKGEEYALRANPSQIMTAIFGADWKEAVGEFLAIAKKDDIIAKASSVLAGMVPAVIETTAQGQSVLEVLSQVSYYYASSEFGKAMTAWSEAAGYVNVDEIRSEAQRAVNTRKDQVNRAMTELREQEAARIRAAADKAEAERVATMKSDPRFRELTGEQQRRFATLGVVGRFNNGDKAGDWGPFTAFAMKDRNAKSGVLYRTKEMLKPRFGAKFIGVSKVGSSSPFADTWAVPARTDIDALLAFLED
jgi:SNF2 family DNA or RNA helicase